MTADAPGLTQVFEHRWSTLAWPIARFTVRLEQIASRNRLALQTWIEEGLGSTTGCAGRLPSGVVIALIERAHAVAHLKARGPDLNADAADAHRLGIDNLLAEALPALGLDASDVDWRNQAPTAVELAAFERYAEERRRSSALSASSPGRGPSTSSR